MQKKNEYIVLFKSTFILFYFLLCYIICFVNATILTFMLKERKKKKRNLVFIGGFYWKFKASYDKNLFYIFHVKKSGFSNQCFRTKEQLSIRKNITDSKFDTQLNAIKNNKTRHRVFLRWPSQFSSSGSFSHVSILRNFKLFRDIAKDSKSMQFWLQQTWLKT